MGSQKLWNCGGWESSGLVLQTYHPIVAVCEIKCPILATDATLGGYKGVKEAVWWMKASHWPFSKYCISLQECCDLEATAAEIEHRDFPRILLFVPEMLDVMAWTDKLGVSFSVNQFISVSCDNCVVLVAAKRACVQISSFSLFNLQKHYKNNNYYCFWWWLTLHVHF